MEIAFGDFHDSFSPGEAFSRDPLGRGNDVVTFGWSFWFAWVGIAHGWFLVKSPENGWFFGQPDPLRGWGNLG